MSVDQFTRARIRRMFYVDHLSVHAIASQLGVDHSAVRRATGRDEKATDATTIAMPWSGCETEQQRVAAITKVGDDVHPCFCVGMMRDSGALLRESKVVCYGFVKAKKSNYPVVTLCRLMQVSTSAFYEWLKSMTSKREQENAQLRHEIGRVFEISRGTYGRRRMATAVEKSGTKG